MVFLCSICEQESTRICVNCTKDACSNHLCGRCDCCSDCCDCEVPLDGPEVTHLHVETIVVEQTMVEELGVPDETTDVEPATAAVTDLTTLHSVPRQEPDEDAAEEPFPPSENNSGF